MVSCMKEEILDKVDTLYKMWQEGRLGGEVMPEDENPHFDKSSNENYLYFTLPMALNYQRNSYKLWESANKTYHDIDTQFVFNPKEVLNRSFKEVQSALTKYGVALQKNKQTEIWITLCKTFVDLYNGDLRNLFKQFNYNVLAIREYMQKQNRKAFPYLCGNKICNYWLYVIWQYTDCNYSNIEMLTVAPDTHVIKSTYHLGLINKEEFESNNVQEIVIEKWNKLFEGTKYKPIDIHTALWLWSRNGFKDLEYYNCLEKVLKTTKEISKNSKYIHINLKAIKNLHLNTSKVGHWLSSNPYGILDLNIEDIVNFLIMYDAIDCCFWGNPKWTIKDSHGNNIDGAFALLYALLKLYKDQGNLNFELITFEKFKDHLKGNIDIPLLKERYQILQKISAVINQKMNGNFYQYIRNIKEDIKLIHIVVNNFSSFTDVRTYNNQTVYFYKLAQLVTSDILHIRSLKENIEVDCSHLVGCADYKIPQVLRGLGVLEYNSELQNIVDNKREIVENSDYEIEIRANTIVAINLIKNELNNKFDAITINDIIWYAGQDKTKNFKPYHLTKTLSY